MIRGGVSKDSLSTTIIDINYLHGWLNFKGCSYNPSIINKRLVLWLLGCSYNPSSIIKSLVLWLLGCSYNPSIIIKRFTLWLSVMSNKLWRKQRIFFNGMATYPKVCFIHFSSSLVCKTRTNLIMYCKRKGNSNKNKRDSPWNLHEHVLLGSLSWLQQNAWWYMHLSKGFLTR